MLTLHAKNMVAAQTETQPEGCALCHYGSLRLT